VTALDVLLVTSMVKHGYDKDLGYYALVVRLPSRTAAVKCSID